jgi:hypothetical protein
LRPWLCFGLFCARGLHCRGFALSPLAFQSYGLVQGGFGFREGRRRDGFLGGGRTGAREGRVKVGQGKGPAGDGFAYWGAKGEAWAWARGAWEGFGQGKREGAEERQEAGERQEAEERQEPGKRKALAGLGRLGGMAGMRGKPSEPSGRTRPFQGESPERTRERREGRNRAWGRHDRGIGKGDKKGKKIFFNLLGVRRPKNGSPGKKLSKFFKKRSS